MLEFLEQHRKQLLRLCEKYEVRRLDLFGSAARGDFNEKQSDLDFLVLFRLRGRISAADRYFGLQADLQHLFCRKIDLVDVNAARNPYFIAEALKHRVMLYAA